jgi:excisionase family DNA binding protein
MSSNFTVKRLCEQCGQVFEAKTTVTRFCSKLCNKRNYKQNIRNSKMAPMDQVVKKVLDKSTPDLKGVEFLSVKAAAALLGASEKIVYSLIHSGKLNAINLSKRKTIVARKDVDGLFARSEMIEDKKGRPNIEDCYHMGQAQALFNISEKALFDLIKRNNILKFQEGKFTYVAKVDLDRIFDPTISYA